MITLKKSKSKNFVVLNLTDIQLSYEDYDKNCTARKILDHTVNELIERVHPDLITISGDLCTEHEDKGYDAFADFFEELGIPWAPIFGNHDNMCPPEFIDEIADRFMKRPLCLYEKGDPEMGNGNFVIEIEEDGKIVSALIMADAHEVAPFTDSEGNRKYTYETFWSKQFDWYKEQIASLKEKGCKDSVLILHTPLFAYRQASEKAYRSTVNLKKLTWEESLSPNVWNEGFEGSCGLRRDEFGAPVFEDGVFALLKEHGHTNHVVAGHDHKSNYIINYNGIKLIYATKTGIGCYYDWDINGGTVLEIGNDGVERVYQEMVDMTEFLPFKFKIAQVWKKIRLWWKKLFNK